jgi:hypothetical protein
MEIKLTDSPIIDQMDSVTIKRDRTLHKWMIRVGGHFFQTPWSDQADAAAVIAWAKEKTGGHLRVTVEV